MFIFQQIFNVYNNFILFKYNLNEFKVNLYTLVFCYYLEGESIFLFFVYKKNSNEITRLFILKLR